MICIGAIYSPKLDVDQTRHIMEFAKATIMANCTIYHRTMNGQLDGLGTSSWEVDEMQALIMLQSMFTWHGEPHQRQAARDDSPTVMRIAKAMGLCQSAPPGHYAYSVLHSGQNHPNAQVDANGWNWHSWLEQEKRNRALYLLFLSDAASGMYVGVHPSS